MTSWLRKERILAAVASGLVGCGGAGSMEPSGPDGEGNQAVKRIMVKLAKGPDSLTARIGKELNETPPPWETIQAQSKDYVLESGELAKQEPKKGSKESWAKLTSALIESADSLEAAARAKDQPAAKVAHDALKNSCKECHRAHRTMGP